MPSPNWKEDKVMLVLAFFTVFFTAVVLTVDFTRPSDGQVYQTFVSLLAGFAGALTIHLKSGTEKPAPPPGSTTVADVHQVTQTPPDTEKKQ